MGNFLQDPTVLILFGAILVGLVLLVWAFGKLKSSKSSVEAVNPPADDLGLLKLEEDSAILPPSKEESPLPNFPIPTPPTSTSTALPTPTLAPTPTSIPIVTSSSPVPKIDFDSLKSPITQPPASAPNASIPPPAKEDVGQRLENMSQKLSDMQSTLQKQPVIGANPPVAGGPIGQGFSSETVDKLLRIVANVAEQIEILQKNLGKPSSPPTSTSPSIPIQSAGSVPAMKTSTSGGTGTPQTPVSSPVKPITPPPASVPAPTLPLTPKPGPITGGLPTIPQPPVSGGMPKPTMPPPTTKGLPPLPGTPKSPSTPK